MAEMTNMSKDWVARACAANPVQKVMNAKGQWTGSFTTGPVRLSWPNLFRPGKPMNEGEEGKFSAAILFPDLADLGPLREEALRVAREQFPKQFGADGMPFGLHFPFRDQGEKANFDGYVPGRFFMSCSTNQRPPVVDTRLQNIVDETRVYPGVWAICSVNCFSWNRQVKKGISFGLQSVMIIADDIKLGASANPQAEFAQVKAIETDTNFSGAQQFGSTPNTQPAPAQSGAPDLETMRQLGLA